MLFRLSRTSFWLAAASAGLALAGPDSLAGTLTVVSVAAGVVAFALWRAAVAQRRNDREDDAAPPPVPLDETTLLDIAAAIARGSAAAGSLDAALREVGRVLKSELGAHSVRHFLVRRRGATHAVVAELVEGQPGRSTGEHGLRLDQMPLGQAVASGRPAGDAQRELAVPVCAGEAVVAVMLLDRIEMAIAPAALARLLELAQRLLAPRADAAAPHPGATEDHERERALERALEDAQAASRFPTVMSHEARTPVNGIPGMTELLLGTALDDRQRHFAQAAYRSGESLLEIVDDDAEPLRAERRVLVVEDNAVNQEVIGQMLRRLGCRVHVASGAMDGLRALCEARFDLVLMDIRMPGMDGIEALRWFRRDPAGRFSFVTPRDTPVVAVTANAMGDDEERFLALGFDDCLPKPFRRHQLLAMLTRQLRLAATAAPEDIPEPGGAGAPLPAAAAGAGAAQLDEAALARLRELDPKGENQLLERVFKAFETSSGRLMPQLDEAHARADLVGIRHVAHTLKSSSASIGAVSLSQQCAELEAMIRLEKVTDLDARVRALRQEVENVIEALRQLLNRKT